MAGPWSPACRPRRRSGCGSRPTPRTPTPSSWSQAPPACRQRSRTPERCPSRSRCGPPPPPSRPTGTWARPWRASRPSPIPAQEPLSLAVDATTSDHRWSATPAQPTLDLPPGASVDVPLDIRIGPDIADQPVRVSVRVRDSTGAQATGAFEIATRPVDRGGGPAAGMDRARGPAGWSQRGLDRPRRRPRSRPSTRNARHSCMTA